MIIGKKLLKQMYTNLDDEQYQPAGIDLTAGEVSELIHNEGTQYGLLKNAKILPKHKKLECKSIMAGGMIQDVFVLESRTPYIITTNEKIKINNDIGQFYLPRSSLLRAGIDVCTAFGDPGFNGHLSFLIINNTDKPFLLEKGVRFAQVINIGVTGMDGEYNGDYNE